MRDLIYIIKAFKERKRGDKNTSPNPHFLFWKKYL